MSSKNKKLEKILFVLIFFLAFYILFIQQAFSADFLFPSLQIGIEKGEKPGDMSILLQIIFLLTILSLAPAILILMTSFTRLAVVFAFLRHALGTQQTPSNQIIAGLALFLTFFIMMPVWQKINTDALQPYLNEEISQEAALKEAVNPIRQFMFKQTREKDLALFVKMAKAEKPKNPADVPTSILIPAFVISELKTAFIIGFVLYVPFLIIDMVVASVLLSMGMMMLPPIMISLPFKLVSMPMLGLGLAVGLIVSIFQAVTQINEMTLTFVPKILIVLLAVLFFASWMLEHLMRFAAATIEQIPFYIR
ncbi:MAG: flagellar biosynthetic protein FliP [Desulfobacterium sp. 4572_20]|nr:MAG: flagellar biosynthetic protein FliP [Desulfobacterium sp. 4572_20]